MYKITSKLDVDNSKPNSLEEASKNFANVLMDRIERGETEAEKVMQLALKMENQELIKRLILSKAMDVNYRSESDFDGRSALHFAAKSAQPSMVKFLLDHGANVNLRTASTGQYTPLHFISRSMHQNSTDLIDAAEILLSNGAEVDARNHFNSTPLHLAANYGNLKLVEVFLNHGSDVNLINRDRSSALFFCASKFKFKKSKIAGVAIEIWSGCQHSCSKLR